jgi:MFS family permease
MGGHATRWAIAAALLLFAALRLHAVHQVAFNWDEFAVLNDVARTAEEGVLHSGGHAGLPQAALVPLVAGCTDEIDVGRDARIAWLLLTWVGLAGVFALLVQLLPPGTHRIHDAALGTALLGLAPVFLEWSLQVRTDQVAFAGGAWGAAALVASRRLPALALVAGLCFGIGWLGTQKLAYLAALGGLLTAGDLFVRGEWRARRELVRLAASGVGAAVVVFGWSVLVSALFEVRESHPALSGTESVAGYLDLFAFYRNTIGYSQYVAALPTLGIHIALFAAMLVAALASPPARTRRLALAWATAALALAVGAFHAAAFAYFLMILGFLVCTALTLSLPSLRAALEPRWPDATRLASPVLWGGLLLFAALHSIDTLRDTQAVQRDSLRFVHRSFSPESAGFHPEKALFCGANQPMRLWFSQHIYQAFESDAREKRIARMITRFRSEPVYYLVQSFRLNQFPVEIRRFWGEHYQPYRDSVFVAGRRLAGNAGDREAFEMLMSATYRWLPVGADTIRVDGQSLSPGATAFLGAGTHSAAFEADGTRGLLVLALEDPPREAPLPFYKDY